MNRLSFSPTHPFSSLLPPQTWNMSFSSWHQLMHFFFSTEKTREIQRSSMCSYHRIMASILWFLAFFLSTGWSYYPSSDQWLPLFSNLIPPSLLKDIDPKIFYLLLPPSSEFLSPLYCSHHMQEGYSCSQFLKNNLPLDLHALSANAPFLSSLF